MFIDPNDCVTQGNRQRKNNQILLHNKEYLKVKSEKVQLLDYSVGQQEIKQNKKVGSDETRRYGEAEILFDGGVKLFAAGSKRKFNCRQLGRRFGPHSTEFLFTYSYIKSLPFSNIVHLIFHYSVSI